MSKNNNITSFFKPVPKTSTSQPSASHRQPSPTPALPTIPSSPASVLPPAPSSPPPFASSSPIAPVPVRQRDAVIRGSDDEDDDDDFSSDDDLPSLFTSKPTAARTRNQNLCATPKAKRAALIFPSSPLTIQTKHKFDFKALLKHQQADSALEASEQRMESALAKKPPTTTFNPTAAAPEKKGTTSLHDTMLDVFPDADGSQEEGNREKLLRAVKRTEATALRKEYFFFDDTTLQKSAAAATRARHPFPKSAATGPWKFLGPAQGRDAFFEDGVPYHIQHKLQNLPDEIFLWVLDEIPHEKSRKLREEYVRLLGVCPDQAGRLMDESLVVKMFQDLGASERALQFGSGTTTAESRHGGPYSQKQDWTALRSVLRILAQTSYGLKIPSLACSIALLLRLGMDFLVREDQAVQRDFHESLCALVQAVPEGLWDQFCLDTSTSLHNHISSPTLRWDAVTSIPLLLPSLVDLRRRLAISFLFDDPARAQLPPSDTFTIHSVIDLLNSDDTGAFTIDRQRTDYFDLAALTGLLSLAIGDGNTPSGTAASPSAVKQYNAEVDALARKIKIMWSNIHEQGAAYVSRLEARVMLKDLERKLDHIIRTRPPERADIFGIRKGGGGEDERDRPKQQNFMKSFFGAGAAAKGAGGERERERSRSPSLPTMPRSGRVPRSP